ncbi:hypothetical protein CYMTET_14848 [Cymbomonas tetramitiformis]|uniref:Uncharacterized protein n=1 Tax=Cymbomonas tetramitiformis TaxID=36881 RepID=A0AAE0GFJ1_9CHLO|nr:hypothetical protein CYMTET_14848 [Cymbomonas tetramitiformis]
MRSVSNEERGASSSQRGVRPAVPQLHLPSTSDRAPAEPPGETSGHLHGTPRAIMRSSRSHRFTARNNVKYTKDLMSGRAATVQGMDAPQATSAVPGAARRQHAQEDETAKAGHPAHARGKARPAAGRWGIKPHAASTIDSFQAGQMAMSEDTDLRVSQQRLQIPTGGTPEEPKHAPTLLSMPSAQADEEMPARAHERRNSRNHRHSVTALISARATCTSTLPEAHEACNDHQANGQDPFLSMRLREQWTARSSKAASVAVMSWLHTKCVPQRLGHLEVDKYGTAARRHCKPSRIEMDGGSREP